MFLQKRDKAKISLTHPSPPSFHEIHPPWPETFLCLSLSLFSILPVPAPHTAESGGTPPPPSRRAGRGGV